MLNLPVETRVRGIIKAFGFFGWLVIFIVTTYLYVQKGCPHTETVYSSSCLPYTYSAGFVPGSSNPPIYLYHPITLSGNTVACYMERYIYTFQNYRGPGYSQTFRSELHCNQAYTGNASLVPSSSYEPMFNRTNYARSAYVDSPKDTAGTIVALIGNITQKDKPPFPYGIPQAACHYIQGDQNYETCGLDYLKNLTTVNITLDMKKYFDRSEALIAVLNTETLFTCARCRAQDVTF
ncbi:hypothetical protein BGZ96_005021, partial [Linnemannia gamsii]